MTDQTIDLPTLAQTVAEDLTERADAIVERWIDWLERRVPTRTLYALDRTALRDHIPPVMRSLCRFIHDPLDVVRQEMLENLRIHAEVRRDQGYDVQELLAEFDGLSSVVTEAVVRRIDELDHQVEAKHVARLLDRVGQGLRSIVFVTVGVYAEREAETRKRHLENLEQYSRSIAHELRTPLNTASIALEVLRDEVSKSPASVRHLDAAFRALRRADHLLDDVRLMSLSNMSQGKIEQMPVAKLVHDTMDELRPLAERSKVEIRLRGGLPSLEVDQSSAQLALINLVSNAIKYRDPSRDQSWVEVHVRVESAQAEPPRATFVVTDNGLGIPEKHQQQVFHRHFRAHPGLAEGTGLGLAITRQTLLERNGRIDLQSTPGEGTRITFSVPARPASHRAGPSRISPEQFLDDAVKQQAEGIEEVKPNGALDE